MSFYLNNPDNRCRPGPICSNPTNGLCEKSLIEVTKVFDACVIENTGSGLPITLVDFNPPAPTLPLTFISADSSGYAPIEDLLITRLENNPNYAQVSGNIVIPLTVTYRDSANILGTGTSTLTIPVSTVLFVPQGALIPVTIKALASVSSSIGTFVSPNQFLISACWKIIIKVVANVDILVPSYGYPLIPECDSSNPTCPGFLETPIYPQAR